MIIGILIKVRVKNKSDIFIRKTFTRASSMLKYWKKIRAKYKKANFYAYRATHPVVKIVSCYSEFIRYFPYCETLRNFRLKKDNRQCPICEIHLNNTHIKI